MTKNIIKKSVSILLLLSMFLLASCKKIDNKENEESENSDVTTEATTEKVTEPATTDDGKLRVRTATYNIIVGRECNYDYSLIAQDILKSGAEIAAFEEVDCNTSENPIDTMKLLSELTGYKYYIYAPAADARGGTMGNGLLSKYPIVEQHIYPLPFDSGWHRNVIHAKIDVNGTIIDYFVTHLQQVSFKKQMEFINKLRSKCVNFVLAGDFNYSNFPDFAIIENSHTVNNERHPLVTTRDHNYFDNFVLSNNLRYENTKVINTKHSDHYLLVTTLVVPKSK